MMGRRLPLRTAAEYDTVGWMRKYLCYLSKPGVTAGIKRQIRRRERRVGKREAQ